MKKLFTFLSLLFTLGLHAQVTTGTLTGTIKDAKEPLVGVTVKATHLPSGTVYGTATNQDGRFNLPNMRTGGPYTI